MHKSLPIAFSLLIYFSAIAQTININGPAGSGKFGTAVTALPNGNYIVTDPLYDDGALVNVGAVYLFNGKNHSIISILTGTSANDSIGNYGITVLDNGNFLISSPDWDNGNIHNAGAITWCDGTHGLSGLVNGGNSLIGSSTDEQLGIQPIIKLTNGNFVVRDRKWANGSETFAGAAIWGDASIPPVGTINAGNALVGSNKFDNVGDNVVPLSNGNYLVSAPDWSNGTVFSAGAVTWCNGSTGRAGVVSSSNSLVGIQSRDAVGRGGIIELANGNYVVKSPYWNISAGLPAMMGAVTWGSGNTGVVGGVSSNNSLTQTGPTPYGGPFIIPLLNGNYVVISTGWRKAGLTCAGAATWGDGSTGVSGEINSSNSLVGNNATYPAQMFIVPLTNGNYVVSFPGWENGTGAATWANGATGITGTISANNSLVGNQAGDFLGSAAPLSNGNYVVASSQWSNGGTKRVGAVIWCNGLTGRTGSVSLANALIGGQAEDQIGSSVVPLSNGNYVVSSPYWDDGSVMDVGAATLVDGATGMTGYVGASNSLIGSQTNDLIGTGGIYALNNGNYIVSSPKWDNGSLTDAGAVTWVNGSSSEAMTVNINNSIIGTHVNDGVGFVVPLTNGNYVVMSLNWNNSAGAVTWGNGTGGVTGAIDPNNSLVGSQPNDQVGFDNRIVQLKNGNYVIRSPYWSNGSLRNAGAVTWCNGSSGTAGIVDSSNSLVGIHANDALGSGVGYSISTFANGQYAVGNMNWDKGIVSNAGAVTWGNGSMPLTGTVTECNSVEGGITISSEKDYMPFSFDSTYGFLLVGRPAENIVSIYNPTALVLPFALDSSSTIIHGNAAVPLQSVTGCRILATVTPNGSHPVDGSIKAKVWISDDAITFNNALYAGRRYEISTATDAAIATARLTLYYTQADFDVFNAHLGNTLQLPADQNDNAGKARLRIFKFAGVSNDGSGLPGTYPGYTTLIDPLDNDIVWNAQLQRWEVSFDINGFSGFFIGIAGNPLPLNLLAFTGRLVGNKTLLDWQTTGEVTTLSFDIERSKDADHYFKIGNVAAANTAGVHHYTFIDEDPGSLAVPVILYRLKQFDMDGSFRYSKVVAVEIDKWNNTAFLFPNPVIEKVNILVNTQKPEHIKARIVDNTGRVIKQYEWKISSGSTTCTVDLTMLASGSYHLDLQGERIHRTFLLFKTKLF